MPAIRDPSAVPQPSGSAEPRTRRVGWITKLAYVGMWGFLAVQTVRLFLLMPALIEIWFHWPIQYAAMGLAPTLLLVSLVVWGLQMIPVLNMWLSFDNDALRGRWPAWRGAMHPGPLSYLDLPYRDIVSVVRRDEICAFLFVPFVRTAYTLVTTEGAQISLALGRSWCLRDFDYAEIANEVAWRIGRPIADGGVVLGAGNPAFRGRPPANAAPLAPGEAERRRKLARTVPAVLWTAPILAIAIISLTR